MDRSRWQERWRSPADAVSLVPSGSRVFVGSNCGMPTVLLAALAHRAREVAPLEFIHGLTFGPAPHLDPAVAPYFHTKCFFVGSNARTAVAEGRADFVPVFLSDIPALLTHGPCRPDVALVQVSPPDSEGWCSLGVAVDFVMDAMNAAKIIIAEVNALMPRTAGPNLVHADTFAAMVDATRPLPELGAHRRDPVFDAIGDHVSSLVHDGDTLQMGIGSIPDAILARLTSHNDLGVHTEMFSDGLIPLVRSGVVNGRRKTLHPGKTIVTFAVGSRALYDFVDGNTHVEFHPIRSVNDPFVAAQNNALVAINAALEIDLTGQVCADSIGEAIYSGIGGQVDFVRAAARSRGGRPIIALPATVTTSAGAYSSRIVARLRPGAGVVTSRGDVRCVVTEFGVADLFGVSLRARADALIAIAHPDFRRDLRARFAERVWFTPRG